MANKEANVKELNKLALQKVDELTPTADARRDFGYTNSRMNRIETSDAECARRINDHVKRHPQ